MRGGAGRFDADLLQQGERSAPRHYPLGDGVTALQAVHGTFLQFGAAHVLPGTVAVPAKA